MPTCSGGHPLFWKGLECEELVSRLRLQDGFRGLLALLERSPLRAEDS